MELSENKMIKIATNMKHIAKNNMELSLEVVQESQNKNLSRLDHGITVTSSMLIQISHNKYINITVHSNAKLKE